jgi:hypothetical protein
VVPGGAPPARLCAGASRPGERVNEVEIARRLDMDQRNQEGYAQIYMLRG